MSLRPNVKWRIIGCFLLIAILAANNRSYVHSKMTFTKIVCDVHDHSAVHVNECRIRLIRRGTSAINVNVTLLKTAEKVHCNAALLRRTYMYFPFLFNQTLDACEFYKNRNNMLGNVIFDTFQKYSTLNHSCPYSGVQYVKDLLVRNDFIMLPIPDGDYALNMTWVMQRKKFLSTTAFFTVDG